MQEQQKTTEEGVHEATPRPLSRECPKPREVSNASLWWKHLCMVFPNWKSKESPCFCQLIPSNNYSIVTELPGAFVLSPNNLVSVDYHEILLISKREVQIILQRTWRPSRLWCHWKLHQNRTIVLNTRTLAKSHLSKIKLKVSQNFCNTSLCMKMRLWRLS